MRSICLALCFTFLSVIKLISADHDHPAKLYDDLCGDMRKTINPLGIMETVQSMAGTVFQLVEGCGKTRNFFASLAKPDMDFKTEEDYDNMCTQLTFGKARLTGNVVAFRMNTTWSCAVTTDKTSCECTFKSSDGKKSEKAYVYFTFANVKAKLYISILCFHELKEFGWVATSSDKSLTPEKHKMIDSNLYSLGFRNLSAATVKMYGDNCP